MDFSAIDKYLEDNSDRLLGDLASLVEIPSKRGSAEEGKPFGSACAAALAKMGELAREAGLSTVNHENYMLECDYNDAQTALGIIAHLDVVPEGSGWTSEPFKLVRKGKAVFGRGTIDDKGPAIAVLYAVKALKAGGAELSENVRLLFGSDEESGMGDLEYYRSRKPLPKMMLSPDGEFPVINVEKGVFQFSFGRDYTVNETGRALASLKAGNVVNAVPDRAEATVLGVGIDEAKRLASEAETAVDVLPCDGGVRLFAKGLSAHGSVPEKGVNALTGLIKLLLTMKLDDSELLRAAAALYGLFPFGESDGAHAGLKMSDAESGALTALFSLFNAENGRLSGGVDIRFPATVRADEVERRVRAAFEPLGAELNFSHVMEGHLVPSDSDFIRTLLDCYTDVTGKEGRCIAEGGATYLHTVDGGVAYGAVMPGEENNMHGADEHINVETLLNIAKIYARAIYKLCK